MPRSAFAVVCLTSLVACFNPDDPAADTDGGTIGSSSGESLGATSAPTSSGSSATTSTGTGPGTTLDPTVAESGDSSGSSTGGPEVPQWGEGDPPDFGDLGEEGEGNVLVVHALESEEAVDVWLVGDAEPVATALAPRDAIRLEGIGREARRVVLARAGTLDAVACSEWFPLRADEQWASVATLGEHDCSGGSNGVTPTFQQTQALAGNTVRFVHAAAADPLTIQRQSVPEPGVLEPGGTVLGTDLPDCENSGCSIGYTVLSPGIGGERQVTFATETVADVPPPGEMMFVVRGNVRQEWPREVDTVSLIAVSIEGDARELQRDPEVAFAAPETATDVAFDIPTPPSVSQVGLGAVCFQEDECPLDIQRFRPGLQEFFANGPAGGASETYDLEAGQRYLLLYTPSGEFILVQDDFSRADQGSAVGRVVNWTNDLLTLGRTFNGGAQPIDNFVDVPAGAVSEQNEVPDGNWDLLSSAGGAALQTGCFSLAVTPVPWRGLFWRQGQINVDSWPPVIRPLGLICA